MMGVQKRFMYVDSRGKVTFLPQENGLGSMKMEVSRKGSGAHGPYSKKIRAQWVEEDSLTSEEDGFMLGYEEGLDHDEDELFDGVFDDNIDEIF